MHICGNIAVNYPLQRLLDSSTSQEHSAHQDQLQTVLQSLLSEAGDLLSLSFTHDYRQHSVITLSSTLKHKSKKLFRAMADQQEGGKEEEGEEAGGSGGGKLEKYKVIERAKEVKRTAQELKKEVCMLPPCFHSSYSLLLTQLTSALMDQLSGAFLQPLGWIEKVEAAAVAAREVSLRKRLRSFTRHAIDMEKVCDGA